MRFTEQVRVRVTKPHRESLDRDASARGKTLSEHVREILLDSIKPSKFAKRVKRFPGDGRP